MSRVPPTTMQREYDIESLVFRVRQLESILNGEIDFGYPDDGTGTQQLLNIRGAWAKTSITNVNQFGAGAGAPVTFTHNLNLPVQTTSRGDTLPNVRPFGWFFTHGDKTGVNAPPAASINVSSCTFHFKLGDAVTADAIQLRVHSGIVATAIAPLLVEIFFHPAVQ